MNEILVDKNGYNQFCKEIERLEKLSRTNSTLGSEAYQDAIGDGWHDNFAFEQTMRESRTIAKKIDDMLEKKKNLRIIEDKAKESNLVNIGDTVLVKIKYSDLDVEEEKIKLTGNYIINTSDDISEITLNSPLGKALYKSEIGKTITYFVGEKEIFVTILSKLI